MGRLSISVLTPRLCLHLDPLARVPAIGRLNCLDDKVLQLLLLLTVRSRPPWRDASLRPEFDYRLRRRGRVSRFRSHTDGTV